MCFLEKNIKKEKRGEKNEEAFNYFDPCTALHALYGVFGIGGAFDNRYRRDNIL